MADAVNGHLAGVSPLSRAVRAVTIVCLPGGGGPHLAGVLRQLGVERPARVRLVGVVPPAAHAPVLIGDPLSGVLWPVDRIEARPADRSSDDELRQVTALRWFLWEMGLDATSEIRRGDPLEVTVEAACRPGVDAVVLAAPACRRWRSTAAEAARRVGGAGAEIRGAFDRRVGRLDRLVAARMLGAF